MYCRILCLLAATGLALAANSAGSLDPGFGNGGIVITDTSGFLFAVAAQTDGKVVAAGTDETSTEIWRIRRYDADGTLDSGFGEVGLTPPGAVDGGPQVDLAIDGSGRILVLGHVKVQTGGRKSILKTMFAVARLTAAGTLDTSFGSGGYVVTQLSADAVSRALAIQPDGRIVVAGYTFVTKKGVTSQAIALVRYHATGALDTGFGSSGIVVDDVTNRDDFPMWDIAVQGSGHIVVGGRRGVGDASRRNWFLRRYLSNGAVDAGFGAGGGVDGGTNDVLRGIAVDTQDRILATGYRASAPNVAEGLVVRYLANGSVDTSFASSGEFLTGAPIREELTRVRAVAGDKVVFAGSYWHSSAQTDFDAVAYRLNADGSRDTSFGTNGMGALSSPGNSTPDGTRDMTVDAGGNIVLGGESPETGQPSDWFLVRYLGN